MGDAISLTSLMAGSLATQSVGTQVAIATMNKSNDIAKQEGAALVQLLNESLPQTEGRLLDTYA